MTWTLPSPWLVKYWKEVTCLIGTAMLVWGAIFLNFPDWDIPLSLVMAFSTYLSADRFVEALLARRWLEVIAWAPSAWWSVDGSYWMYWSFVDTSVMTRAGQWPTSLCLYLLAGLVWTAFRPEMPAKGPARFPCIPE